ncbi:hypothetical protein ACFORJ_08670 [Corynebacterium hansenii]|uniref:ABC transporter permease n=1 Tax=Corynebacterium hansenii TaxID=394964 RepID=A0ABV7ZQ27_9CORY|nr:hypothetical protein [Corynebacterium hansenii]WJZ00824.1 ABC-2 family transporter protein [Corynebacterium hansenii]
MSTPTTNTTTTGNTATNTATTGNTATNTRATGSTTANTATAGDTTTNNSSTAPPTFAMQPAPVPGALNLLGSELGRMLNLRSTWGYIISILAFTVGLPVMAWLTTRGGATAFRYEPTFDQVLVSADIVVILAMIFAAAGSASEISGRRVAFGYLTANSRPGVHVARMAAQLIIVAATVIAGFAIAAGFLAAVGVLVPEKFALAAGMVGMMLLWAAIGSAVGMLVPVTAVAVGLPIAWIMVIEMAVSQVPVEFFQTLSKYLPWIASRQLTGMMDTGISGTHAGLVLAAWAIAVIGGGLVAASRRDVK